MKKFKVALIVKSIDAFAQMGRVFKRVSKFAKG